MRGRKTLSGRVRLNTPGVPSRPRSSYYYRSPDGMKGQRMAHTANMLCPCRHPFAATNCRQHRCSAFHKRKKKTQPLSPRSTRASAHCRRASEPAARLEPKDCIPRALPGPDVEWLSSAREFVTHFDMLSSLSTSEQKCIRLPRPREPDNLFTTARPLWLRYLSELRIGIPVALCLAAVPLLWLLYRLIHPGAGVSVLTVALYTSAIFVYLAFLRFVVTRF